MCVFAIKQKNIPQARSSESSAAQASSELQNSFILQPLAFLIS